MAGKYALVIGNSEYHDATLSRLKTPEADVRLLAAALRNPNIGGFDDVQELIDRDEGSIRRAISAFFFKKKSDDTLLLYFSGHGVLDAKGRLFLAAKDTQRDQLKATAISDDFISDSMDDCRSKRQILILDCCHSGAYGRGKKGSARAVTESTFKGNGTGRVVLTASDSTQYAVEGDQFIEQASLSLFTHYLLDGLTTGEADSGRDGWITLDEWYDYAYDRVVSENPDQTPSKWAYKQQGELVIAKNPFHVMVSSAHLPERLRARMQSGYMPDREEAIQELEGLLEEENPALAQLARAALEQLAADDDSSLKVRRKASTVLERFPGVARPEQVGEKIDQERLAREKAEAERLAAEKAERDRVRREKARQKRLDKQQAEREASQQAEARRIEQEAERERQEVGSKTSGEKETEFNWEEWLSTPPARVGAGKEQAAYEPGMLKGTIGIETLGGVFTAVLAKGIKLPAEVSQVFSTAEDNQSQVEIHLLIGERPMAADNRSLGKFLLSGIPPAPKGIPQIEVKITVGRDHVLRVTATDKATQKSQSLGKVDLKTIQAPIEPATFEEVSPEFDLTTKEAPSTQRPRSTAVSTIVAIDFGTTHSLVAVMKAGKPVVIPGAEGELLVPSVVATNKNHERIIGRMARYQAMGNTIFSIKRFIGRKYDDPDIKELIRRLPYKAAKAPNGDVRVILDGKEYFPAEITAMILAKVKANAEAYLSQPITQAVIAVPTYFNDIQRNAIKDAGKIAGLEVLRLINDTTAASLAYGLKKKQDEVIAVYDLGGGFLDFSIVEIGDGVFQVRSTNGDAFLGGDDFDQRIIDYVTGEFQREHKKIDLRKDHQALQRLREAAEKAKIELSSVTQTEINLPYITADASGPKHLTMTLTRAKLEQLTADLIERSLGPVRQALKDADLHPSKIDEVILVGGMTRMPAIQEAVRKLFGKNPHSGVNPGEAVAVGAAIQAGVLGGTIKDVLVLDVTSLSLCVETLGGVATKMIERNTTLPTRKSQIFSTATDNQPQVEIHVLQGERPMAADNKSLGRFILDGIPPAPRGVPQIEVTFDIDANGILNVIAQDKATGRTQNVTVTASSGLTEEEVERMRRDAEAYANRDRRR